MNGVVETHGIRGFIEDEKMDEENNILYTRRGVSTDMEKAKK